MYTWSELETASIQWDQLKKRDFSLPSWSQETSAFVIHAAEHSSLLICTISLLIIQRVGGMGLLGKERKTKRNNEMNQEIDSA